MPRRRFTMPWLRRVLRCPGCAPLLPCRLTSSCLRRLARTWTEVSRVVHELPEAPVSPEYRTYRMDCATWYLALGDDRGLSIRGAVWERVGGGWRYTSKVETLAKSSGMRRDELDSLSQHHQGLIPGWQEPVIQERVRSSRRAKAWIPWWDLADIVKARATEPGSDRSDPGRSGQLDEPDWRSLPSGNADSYFRA